MEEIDISQIESTQYSEAVINAVRYGYLYRKEAEHFSEEGISFHFHLSGISPFLLWLAKQILSDICYNSIKKSASKLWEKLMSMKVSIPDEVNKVLLDEDELKTFVTYTQEFAKKQLSSTDEEKAYIREEIIADYVGKATSEFWTREKRFPTDEERQSIIREAYCMQMLY